MTRILVTGAGGQLGMTLQKMANISRLKDVTFTFRTSEELDITDKEALKGFLNTQEFDYCINTAAFTDVEESEREPVKAFEVNDNGVGILADLCRAYRIVLIHISTDYVFDGTKSTGYLPDDCPNPINEYGRSKWAGEQRIIQIMQRYFIIRTSWLYSEYGRNFYKTIIEKANTEKVIYVTDAQRGCPTHADNLAAYIMGLIESESESYGIHHYTDGEAMTWYEFAQRIVKERHLALQVEVATDDNYRSFAARPKNSVLIPNPAHDS